MLGSRRHYYLAIVSILLITVTLIAVLVGCVGTTPVEYYLTMAVMGGGSAIDLTNASPYSAGTVVSIEAVAAPGYGFRNWTATAGAFGNATAAQTTFTMPFRNATVTANFGLLFRGSGTEGDPYQIADWYQLNNVRNYSGSHFILVNNLDSVTAGYTQLASSTANSGKGWQPIGTSDNPFTGTLDGQGYEIGDLLIDRPAEDYVGLFGCVDFEGAGAIDDVGVVNINVTGFHYVGGLVGWQFGGNISSSHTSGSVVGTSRVGGLVGVAWGGNIHGSYTSGSMSGLAYVGGLVGFDSGGSIGGSHSSASVAVSNAGGGLVGCSEALATVDNCYASGNVTSGGGDRIGGLMGEVYSSTISDSYATGSVIGFSRVGGGLVGENVGTVASCYSTGNVTSLDGDDVGGLVGLTNPYWGSVTNSFWDTETSGQPTSDGGTGKNTTEMHDISTFAGAGWDIVAVANSGTRNTGYIWNIVDDVTYAFLSWQPVA